MPLKIRVVVLISYIYIILIVQAHQCLFFPYMEDGGNFACLPALREPQILAMLDAVGIADFQLRDQSRLRDNAAGWVSCILAATESSSRSQRGDHSSSHFTNEKVKL